LRSAHYAPQKNRKLSSPCHFFATGISTAQTPSPKFFIAVAVAEKAWEQGLAREIKPVILEKVIADSMYNPEYLRKPTIG